MKRMLAVAAAAALGFLGVAVVTAQPASAATLTQTKRRWFAALAALGVAVAVTAIGAGPASAESNGDTRVMPLGDSITEGTQVPGGYRIGLWQRLVNGRYTVDYVGSQFNGPSGLGDHDHEGHPGWRIDQIDANVVGWLIAYRPRSVLLHIGTNDILQNFNVSTAPSRLSTLVDRVTNTLPDADVFVAQIIPLANSGQEAAVRNFNSQIPGIVQSKVNAGKRVHLVDMHSALTTSDLIDGIHPTAAAPPTAPPSSSGTATARPTSNGTSTPAAPSPESNPDSASTRSEPAPPTAPGSTFGAAMAAPTSSGARATEVLLPT